MLAPPFFLIPSSLPPSLSPSSIHCCTCTYNSVPSLFLLPNNVLFQWTTCSCHVADLVSAVRELVAVATSTVTPLLKNNTVTQLFKETKEVATATTILCSLAETLRGNKFSLYHIHKLLASGVSPPNHVNWPYFYML